MVKVNSIFIANIAEIAKSLTSAMPKQEKALEIFEDHAYSDRFLFTNEDNRLLITPFPLEKEFLTDTCRLCRYQNFLNFSPKKIKESTCEALLADKQLIDLIIKLIKKNPKIRLLAYAATDEFKMLVDYLKKKGLKFETPELSPEKSHWTTKFFDSKSGFRQTLSNFNYQFPAMPQGVICNRKEEVLGWTEYFLKHGKKVVIKTNRGLAGAGMEILDFQLLKKNLKKVLNQLYLKHPYWQKDVLVVEEYIEPNLRIGGGAPDVEVKVTSKGEDFLYVCGMRISKGGVFEGIELGKGILTEEVARLLKNFGQKFGNLLYKFGYRGIFDVDFVVGKNGQLYPLEANLRRTGGTHAFELGQRLLGHNFSQKYYLISVLKMPISQAKLKTYSQVKKAVVDFLFPIKNKNEGVILTVVSYLRFQKLGYLVIAQNKKQAYRLEKEFLTRL